MCLSMVASTGAGLIAAGGTGGVAVVAARSRQVRRDLRRALRRIGLGGESDDLRVCAAATGRGAPTSPFDPGRLLESVSPGVEPLH